MAEKTFVKLTEAEIAERSRLLAYAVCKVEDLKDDARDSAKNYRAQIKELNEEIQELATAIRSGHEERDAQMELGVVARIRDSVA